MLSDLIVLFLLVVIGFAILILISKVLLFVLLGVVAGFAVYYLTGNLLWAGVAFIFVSLITIYAPRKGKSDVNRNLEE